MPDKGARRASVSNCQWLWICAAFIEVPLEETLRLPRNFAFNPAAHINSYNVTTFRSLVQSCGAQILAARLP
jgi:hypothetical protein